MADDKKQNFNAQDLPDNEVFKKKEIFQHPQPADQGKALDEDDENNKSLQNDKEAQRSSNEEGLNEERSTGNAGAFEGFENQKRDENI